MSFAADIGRMVALGPKRPLTDADKSNQFMCLQIGGLPEAKQVECYVSMSRETIPGRNLDQYFKKYIGTDVKFSPALLVYLAGIAESQSQTLLMVAVLAYMRAEGRELTLESLLAYGFRDGLPTKVAFDLAFEAQICQINGVNLLKNEECWK